MTTKYFTCAETAKLIRQSLKEAFSGAKFSVRSSAYSGGASISVSWTDGPNPAQVESITRGFKAAYFDGSIDYQGSIHHMMDGQQVHFGADYITTSRHYSDAAIQRAIDYLSRRYAGNFKESRVSKPTVEQFRSGELYRVQLEGLHWDGSSSVQTMIHAALDKHTDGLKVNASATAGKKFITHDDGYSRQCGAGFSAVSVDAD
ncbi:LPD29 domain-containing protein [Caballeronia sp. SBC2]|uniref:LPD29 domain-containing protein n=1 Tax=Caballeronia sp. SBC2 TaxID=2705547 RepID=UPI0013E139DD|nr:LPD29 domain-containing protein [Caballeronia sp. SBC2]QIE30387.1 Large polyvalent protein associated domain 29 [Caballeronia sp. SBC2]